MKNLTQKLRDNVRSLAEDRVDDQTSGNAMMKRIYYPYGSNQGLSQVCFRIRQRIGQHIHMQLWNYVKTK